MRNLIIVSVFDSDFCGRPPRMTLVFLGKFWPVMVTTVPTGPDCGEKPSTLAGAALTGTTAPSFFLPPPPPILISAFPLISTFWAYTGLTWASTTAATRSDLRRIWVLLEPQGERVMGTGWD